MDAKFTLGSDSKRLKTDRFDVTICIFCKLPFNKLTPSITPDINRIDTLFNACRQRQDEVGKQLLSCEKEIRHGNVSVYYHRNCRSTYTSQTHIQRIFDKQSIGVDATCSNEQVIQKSRLTRHSIGSTCFEWKKNCFLCGKGCFEKKKSEWSLVASSVDTGNESMYSKILKAAEKRDDVTMLVRLGEVPNGDLVAIEARYHRKKGCYASYVNPNNLHAVHKQNGKPSQSIHDKVLHQLIDEISPDIKNNKVFLLSTLMSRYQEILSVHAMDAVPAERYTTQKLKQKLLTHCPSIAFIPQHGISDLVCSSNISVGDALRKANELVSVLQNVQTVTEMFGENSCTLNKSTTTDESVVHHAAAILRKRILKTRKLDNEYYSFDEMCLNAQKEFVDELLYKFLILLTEGEQQNLADSMEEVASNAKCLHFACDITTAATTVMSPKHLGLAVYLHNEFGSRKLIDAIHNMGYSISYTELRQFTTSVTHYVNSLQIPTSLGSYLPPEIVPVTDSGNFIVAAADNWDHNERTIDGKGTTHAMTSILVQAQSEDGLTATRIQRISSRSLDTSQIVGAELTSVLEYKKPTQRPEPIFTPSISTDELSHPNSEEYIDATLNETIYNMCRSGAFQDEKSDPKVIPPWKRFHCTVSMVRMTCSRQVSRIAFNPIIMAPPTDHTTIFTTLMKLKETANTLGQKYIPVFFDMGLLTKALEITWSRPKELAGVIPCEGGMHLLMSVFSAVGYLYGDAGLKQLLHESGVFAAGTVNQMLSGKDFDRAMYGMELIDEAMHARLYQQFMLWCRRSGTVMPHNLSTMMENLEVAVSEENVGTIDACLAQLRNEIRNNLLPLLEEFRSEGRAISPTFRFWDDFLRNVLEPIKLFVSSTRNALWLVNQETKLQLLPLLFAANRTNYARYLTVSILMMKRLPVDVLEQFQKGHFVAKLTSGEFNNVWMDYTIEATENKALKGSGGIIGLTLRGSSLVRWFMARPITSQYAMKFKENVCVTSVSKEKQNRYISSAGEKRWNSDIQKLTGMFDSSFIDPFDTTDAPAHLVNIATGAVAPAAIEESLLNAINKGNTLMTKFVKERLIDTEQNQDENQKRKSLYDSLPRSGVKTMSEMQKTVTVKKKNIVMDGEIMYLRLLAVNATKKVPLARVMSFENAPVPLSMFGGDGKMISSAKSQLMPCLEGLSGTIKVTSIPKCDAIVYDGHACIQMMNTKMQITASITFDDMARRFMNTIIYNGLQSNSGDSVEQIHIVFDKYLEDSIKGQTREKRIMCVHGNKYEVKPDMRIPANWKQFLSNGENKSSLANLYTSHMRKNGMLLNQGQTLVISGGQEDATVEITCNSVTDVPHLRSNHEEADTRLVLHAIEASQRGADKIVVSSPDTDVLVLLIHHRPAILASKIYLLTGRMGKHANLQRYIPVHEIHDHLTLPQRSLLLSAYCLTGCDTTSSFFGHGKKSVFREIIQKAAKYSDLAELGTTPELTQKQFVQCMMFIGAIYGRKECESLNRLRCEKAEKNIPGKKLPPTEDSFHLHVLRCVYQLIIWRNAHIAIHGSVNPLEFGYEKDPEIGSLQPQLMSQSPAAPELLNNLICDCQLNGCLENCSCKLNGQCCTAACSCEASVEDCDENMCSNPLTLEVLRQLNVDSDSD